jgi:hypothetical protein
MLDEQYKFDACKDMQDPKTTTKIKIVEPRYKSSEASVSAPFSQPCDQTCEGFGSAERASASVAIRAEAAGSPLRARPQVKVKAMDAHTELL